MLRSIKLVLVGDEAVGKTCLGLSYTNGYIITDHIPTVFDHYSTCVQIDNECINIGVWDSAGQDEYDSLRPVSYAQTWYPEIHHYCPGVPFILVGTKLDLRECINTTTDDFERRSGAIQYVQGLQLSQRIGAVKYMECSSTTLRGVVNVFEEAIRATFSTPDVNRKRWLCNIF